MGQKTGLEAAAIYEQLVNQKTSFRSGNKKRTGTRLEVTMWSAISAALKGNIDSAKLLLHMHEHSARYGDFKADVEFVTETEADAVKRRAREKAAQERAEKETRGTLTIGIRKKNA